MSGNNKKSLWSKIGLTVDPTEQQGVKPSETPAFPKSSEQGFPKPPPTETTTQFPKATKEEAFGDFDEGNSFEKLVSSESNFNEPITPQSVQKKTKSTTNPHLESIKQLYEKGFAEMNKEGIDFHEFYMNMISTGGIDNLLLYPMAFNMHKTMNPAFTKESVLSDANEYINKIETAYLSMRKKGLERKDSRMVEKEVEKSSLNTEISSLETQIRELKVILENKKAELNNIDNKYEAELEDIEMRLEAHDIAKESLVNNITKVANNINQTIN